MSTAPDVGTVITVMDQNVEDFAKADQLPMRTMPWFFVAAGIVLIVLAPTHASCMLVRGDDTLYSTPRSSPSR